MEKCQAQCLRVALQQRLVELVGEELARGVHVVLVREAWFEPQMFRTREPSAAQVAGLEKELRPTQPMQDRVESMCIVGSCWPVALARAMAKRRELHRLEQKDGVREATKRSRMEETLRTKAHRRSKRNQKDLQRKLRARAKSDGKAGTASASHARVVSAGDSAAEAAGGEVSGPHPLPSDAEDMPVSDAEDNMPFSDVPFSDGEAPGASGLPPAP